MSNFEYTSKPRNERQVFSVLLSSDDVVHLGDDGFLETVIDEAGAHLAEDFNYGILYTNPKDDVCLITIEAYPSDFVTHPKDLEDDELEHYNEFSVEVLFTLDGLISLKGETLEEKIAGKLEADGFKSVDISKVRICGATSESIRVRIVGFFE